MPLHDIDRCLSVVKPLFLAALLACSGVSRADPAIDYMLNCQGCHLADGKGLSGSVPDLRGTLGRLVTVPGGRDFLVQVPGSSNAPLDDAALAALINWMLPKFSADTVPTSFVPFTEDEVAALRRERLEDVSGRRAELIEALEAR
jgi:hypothetical protein